jgi:hypothetical protein
MLSAVTNISIRRFFYPEPGKWLIIFCISITLLVGAWKYFNRKGIIMMSLSSTIFQRNLPVREQVFMLAFGYFSMPVWNFHQLSVGEIWWSIIVFSFISYLIYCVCSKGKK